MDWDKLISHSCDFITWTSEIKNIMYDNQLTSVFDSHMAFPTKPVIETLSKNLKLKQLYPFKNNVKICQNFALLLNSKIFQIHHHI